MDRNHHTTSLNHSFHYNNNKNTKTNHATNPNGRNSIGRDPTTVRRTSKTPPPAAPNATPSLPSLPPLAPPSESTDLDVLLTSFLARLRQAYPTTQTPPTPQPMPMPMTKTTTTTHSNTATTQKTLIDDTPATAPTLHATPLPKSHTDVEENFEVDFLLTTPKLTSPTTTTLQLHPMEPTRATPLPPQPITVPLECIDFAELKASIRAGLIRDTITRWMLMLMPTTTQMPTMQQTITTMTENTVTTETTMLSDPTQSTVIGPTLHDPQQQQACTTNAARVGDDVFPPTLPTMQRTKPTTVSTEMTEKTKMGDTPAAASTFYDPQQLLQATEDDVYNTEDEFPTLQPTMMPNKPTITNTKTTEKPMIGNPSTLRKPEPLTQSTVEISANAADDILMILLTAPPTTTLMTATTYTTKQTTIADTPATASLLQKPQTLMHFTGDLADDTEADPTMPIQTMMKPMTIPTTMNDSKNTKMKRFTYDRSTAITTTLSNTPPLMQPTVELADDVEHKFEPRILKTNPTTNSPTPLPDYLISESHRNDPTTYHSTTTINWVRDTFAAVSKALDRLEIATATLYDSIFAATSKSSLASPPMPSTPDPQPHCRQPQPQPTCPIFPKLHHLATIPHHVTTHTTMSQLQRRHQHPYPQQTNCHRNHTKHRHFLCPPLPSPNHHFRKCLPVPGNIRLPTYHRYLANNFQPP